MNRSIGRSLSHPLVASLAGLALFLMVSRVLAPPLIAWLGAGAFGGHVLLKLLLLACVLGLISLDPREASHFGLRRSEPGAKWGFLGAGALLLGTLSSTLITIAPAQGITNLQGLGLPELVVSVWIISSVAEEFLTRGLVYGWLSPTQRTIAGLPVPVAATAVLFGAMHLTLFWTPTDRFTIAIVIASTTALGLLCGLARHRTGSLWPAVWVHALFNVGGFLGGILMVVLGLVELPPR